MKRGITQQAQSTQYKLLIKQLNDGKKLTNTELAFVAHYENQLAEASKSKKVEKEVPKVKVSITEVAESLGINRQYIYEVLKEKGKTIDEFKDPLELQLWLASNVKKLSEPKIPADENVAIEDIGDKTEEELLEESVKESWVIRKMTESAVKVRISGGGNAKEVIDANRVWADVNKVSLQVVRELKDLQERIGRTIELDVLFPILADTLNRIKDLVVGIGAATANQANPEDPERAKQAVNRYVDELLEQMGHQLASLEIDVREQALKQAEKTTTPLKNEEHSKAETVSKPNIHEAGPQVDS